MRTVGRVCGREGKTRHDKLCGKRNGCNAGVGGIKVVLRHIGDLKERGLEVRNI
jgi:hypothetical protein